MKATIKDLLTVEAGEQAIAVTREYMNIVIEAENSMEKNKPLKCLDCGNTEVCKDRAAAMKKAAEKVLSALDEYNKAQKVGKKVEKRGLIKP